MRQAESEKCLLLEVSQTYGISGNLEPSDLYKG